MFSKLDSGESNGGYIYFNNNALSESRHLTSHFGSNYMRSTAGREVTLAATAGDTIYFKTSTMKDAYNDIYFCVAFEHGSNPQSRFSPRDEEISHPKYQDHFPADDEDIPSPENQDHFPDDEEYFSLEKSTCSSNTDCPPHLACIRLALVRIK